VSERPPEWTPSSWRGFPVRQQPVYPDLAALDRTLIQLSRLPPLVTSWEVLQLKSQLAEAAAGKRFLLQGGDCAERFEDCDSTTIANKLKILLQMSLVLVHGSQKPVIRVGRFAGQYAKPRSDDNETRDGVTLPAFRGDVINGAEFSASERVADPMRLLRGYGRSALTLNFIRALSRTGFADLHHPENWDLDFAKHSPMENEYHQRAAAIGEALRFMENILGVKAAEIEQVDFFSSHEALLLCYEEAQTRRVPRQAGWFNLSTHFPWIGMRTADPDGAHVEYFRGISNPIGVKVGPSMTLDRMSRILDVLHPVNEPGRFTLIHRFGAERIADYLPGLIDMVRSSGKTVVWCCDPMHGNTRVSSTGVKTRAFADILSELEKAVEIHSRFGSRLGGIHFELTGENVTECTGGARGLSDADLSRAYRTEVDPRLNYEQALEIAMLVARKLGESAR
jgi:3-deoxy-7-phosphoheptulonate synthase